MCSAGVLQVGMCSGEFLQVGMCLYPGQVGLGEGCVFALSLWVII